MLVDVTGIEPVTPCLQSKQESTMWLILLAFTYVTQHGFRGVWGLLFPFCSQILRTARDPYSPRFNYTFGVLLHRSG